MRSHSRCGFVCLAANPASALQYRPFLHGWYRRQRNSPLECLPSNPPQHQLNRMTLTGF